MSKAARTDNNNETTGRKRATSYDVVGLAGVSQSAVSRVFQDGASASKAMRDQVTAAADELGQCHRARHDHSAIEFGCCRHLQTNEPLLSGNVRAVDAAIFGA